MSTDRTYIHLLLDSIREEQHHQGAMLLDITERQEEALKLLKGIFRLVRDRPSAKPSRIAALLPQLATGTFNGPRLPKSPLRSNATRYLHALAAKPDNAYTTRAAANVCATIWR